MSVKCRVLQSGWCEITQGYKKGYHDGIDIVNSKNIYIKDSFVHSFDDTIVIKGHNWFCKQSNVNMVVDNCVLLCDWGRAMEIGLETECREYRDIEFRNCHIVRAGNCACDIHNGDCAEVHNITFENISVELESFYTKEQGQNSEDESYKFMNETIIPDIFRVSNPRFREICVGAGVGDTSRLGQPDFASTHNIIVKNISVYADDKIINEYETNCVRIFVKNQIPTTEYKDLVVENISLNGKRLKEEDIVVTIEGCEKSVLTIR